MTPALLFALLLACAPDTFDADRDGVWAPEDDCDDADPSVYPGAPERCDGLDNDCDGDVDEDVMTTFWADVDGDGYGDPDAPVEACALPEGAATHDGDCDDASADAFPGAVEVCGGGDEDCDGTVDEPDAVDAPTWYADIDGDGYGDPDAPAVACVAPADHVADATDCDDTDAAEHPGADEVCDGDDDDCDGLTDEPDAVDASTWHLDYDGDGHGAAGYDAVQCEPPVGWVELADDCDDTRPAVHPGADEWCNGLDDDCDGLTDEPDAVDALPWYLDEDTDSHGLATDAVFACAAPTGRVADGDDCDDRDGTEYPGAAEVCDGDDDDCDGDIDEDDAVGAPTWYLDADDDGWGVDTTTAVACAVPAGFAALAGDCDDGEPAVSPGAAEVCNNWIDDDCDGDGSACRVDDTDVTAAWATLTGTSRAGLAVAGVGDLDGDGVGDLAVSEQGFTYAVPRVTAGTSALAGAGLATPTTDYASALAGGDLTGDGLSDVVLGLPYLDSWAGAAAVLAGPVASTPASVWDAHAYLQGEPMEYLAAGATVAAADVTGDGADDLLVSVPGDDLVRVVEGPVAGWLDLLNAEATLYGPSAGKLLATGDVDGDGVDDVLVANSSSDAWLVEGPVLDDVDLVTDAVAVAVASTMNLGAAALGDVDGDGFDDVVLAGFDKASTAWLVQVFCGPVLGATPDYTLVGPTGASADALALGDVDGDGADELLIGVPSQARAFLVDAPPPGTSALEDYVELTGAVGDETGTSLGISDVNGDDYPDLILGAPGSGPGGAAWIVLGGGR